YHDLKTVGHMVLGLHALLAPYGDGKLSAPRLFELKAYRDSTEKVRLAIHRRGLTKAQEDRQEKLLMACLKCMGEVIEAGRVEVKEVQALVRKLGPLLADNSREAARAQIHGLHREMKAHRARLSDEEWKSLRVIVQGSQQPRKNNLAV